MQAEELLNPFDVRGRDDASPFVDIGHDPSFKLIAAGRPRVVAKLSEPLDCRRFRQNIGYQAVQAIRDGGGYPSRPSKSLPRGNDISRKSGFGTVGTFGKLKNRLAPVTASGRS